MAPATLSHLTPEYLASLSPQYLSENIGDRLINVAIAFIVLETIFIVLFYISRHLNKTLNGLECYLLMPTAYMFCIATCVCGVLLVKLGGAGRHIEAVLLDDPSIIVARSKIDKGVEYVYAASIVPSKLAILSLYMRIFSSQGYRRTTYFVGALVIITWLTSWALSSSMCRPFAFQWDHSIPGGKCLDIMAVYTWISVPNIVTDVCILVLPLPAIYKLHVDLATKTGIILTLLTGSMGLVTGILRMIEFMNATELFQDPTYRCIPTFTFTIVESGTYMIAACMPTLRPLKRKIFNDVSISRKLMSAVDRLTGRSNTGSSIVSAMPGGMTWSSKSPCSSDAAKIQKSPSQDTQSAASADGSIKLQDVSDLSRDNRS